jgi:hypothetical protein
VKQTIELKGPPLAEELQHQTQEQQRRTDATR